MEINLLDILKINNEMDWVNIILIIKTFIMVIL